MRILGPLEIFNEGAHIALRGKREKTILALLALAHGEVVSIGKMVAALWEDSEPPNTAEKQVRNIVSELRSRHPTLASVVQTDSTGYRLRLSECVLDRTQFLKLVGTARATERDNPSLALEDYRRAIAMWRGSVVEDIDNTTIETRARPLNDERLDALERWLQLELDLGELSFSQVTMLDEILLANPFRERLTSLFMNVLVARGSRDGALAVYRRTEDVMRSDLGVAPGPLLQQSLKNLVSNPEVTPSSRSFGLGNAIPVPNHGTPNLIGRDALMERAVSAATSRPHRHRQIIAIDGMPGVGKTAFALALAACLSDRFPDGILFVDLGTHSTSREPVASTEAIEVLLRGAGLSASDIPSYRVDRQRLWGSIQMKKRFVVVLDDVDDEAQVEALAAERSESIVVVTSRNRLTGLGIVTAVTLDPLDPQSGADLFAAFVGDDRPETDLISTRRIVALCGGLPSAIHFAASRIRHRPAWTMAGFADHLGANPCRLLHIGPSRDSLASAFEMSFRRLDCAHKDELVAVVLRAGANRSPIESIANPGSFRERMLEDLVDAHLLEHAEPGCYRVHMIVRLYLTDLISRPELSLWDQPRMISAAI